MSLLDQYIVTEPVESEPEAPNALGSLADIYQTVSEEAFTVGDLNNYLQRRSAKISAMVQDSFRTLTTFNFKKPEQLNVAAMTRSLNTRDYTDLVELQVYIPVGFQGELKDYVAVLAGDAERLVTGIVHEVLQPTQKCFAHYVNQPLDTNDRRELIYKHKHSADTLTQVKEAVAKFHISGNRRTTAELGEVFENKNAIVTVADMVNKLNQTLWRQVPPERVEQETNKLVKLSSALFGILESSDNNSSPEFVKGLVQQLKEVGEFVEWYAAYQTHMADLTAVMKHNEKMILDIQA